MKLTPAKLFHAVVISGAALTGCATTATKPVARDTPVSAPSTSDVSATSKHAPDTQAPSGGVCPPGSERPFPPCYWIK